jgi:hypothetical protein
MCWPRIFDKLAGRIADGRLRSLERLNENVLIVCPNEQDTARTDSTSLPTVLR